MPTNKDIDYNKAHAEIDEAIEESIKPSPDNLRMIAEKLGDKYHISLIHRRFLYKWKRDGGRWVRKTDE
jgi:hypothetical protein